MVFQVLIEKVDFFFSCCPVCQTTRHSSGAAIFIGLLSERQLNAVDLTRSSNFIFSRVKENNHPNVIFLFVVFTVDVLLGSFCGHWSSCVVLFYHSVYQICNLRANDTCWCWYVGHDCHVFNVSDRSDRRRQGLYFKLNYMLIAF